MFHQTILNLDDISFLKAVVSAYPETKYMLDNTLESASAGQARESNLAYQIFNADEIQDTAEFNRAAVGLLCLKYVLTGNYEAFTACQNPAVRLSQDTFRRLQDWTNQIIQTETDFNTAIYAIMCNDLGKTKFATRLYQAETGHSNADHDAILSYLLTHRKDMFSGFISLPTESQQAIQDGLSADFNLGQFVQGENLPANLERFINLPRKAADLFILHAFYDIAGAAGHVRQNGSLVMTEATCQSFLTAAQCLTADSIHAYQNYIHLRGMQIGVDTSTNEGFAVARIAALSRVLTKDDANPMQEAWALLPKNVRAILINELNISGQENECGILLYYAPALINNAQKFYLSQLSQDATSDAREQAIKEAYTHTFTALAEMYQSARIALRQHRQNGVITVDINQIAKQSLQNAELLHKTYIDTTVDLAHAFGHAFFKEPTQIQVANYPHTQNIQNILPSGKSVYIGIGGGSDVVQAAQVATIAEKPIACIISVRADKTQSQGDKNTQIGMKRTVENHGGEVVPNVYRIRPETIGNGRFMENIPTQTGAPVYLVLDSGNGQLSYQIESAIKDAGGAENIVCIDTGGDCLYLAQNDANSTAKATPDQDYATLKAVHQLSGYRKFSCVLATGVDAPDYADEVLSAAQAQFATLSPKQAETLLQNYQKWGMDGSTQSIIGKTPLALQNALRHKEGLTVLDLPERVVTDKNNPWNPFVVMTEPMRFIAVMDLDKHFNAIVPIKNNQNTVQKYVQMKQNTRS